jgi:hypothetical protein
LFALGVFPVEKQHAVSGLRQMFLALDSSTPDCRVLHATPFDFSLDVYDFARSIVEDFEAGDHARIRAAFDRLEKLLLTGDRDLHDWVFTCLDALQNAVCWRGYGSGAFAPFLGRRTHALWEALDASRVASQNLDLADCSVLEAEILTWRVVHEKVRLQTGGC